MDARSDVQQRYVNVSRNGDLHICMFLGGQFVLKTIMNNEIMLKGLFTYRAVA